MDEDTPTQREEFEEVFGSITDDQWQRLKEYFHRCNEATKEWHGSLPASAESSQGAQ
jgi:hypothetical protein